MKNLFSIAGKVAVITGGSRGIGAMIARGFLENGAKVYISARKEEELKATAQELSALGECIPIVADLGSQAGTEAFAKALQERESKIDILVNNAGGGPPVAAASASPELTQKIISLNLLAPLVLSQQAHALLTKTNDVASIVNIASVSGARGSPGTAAYGAAKAGLLNVTKSLAMEWGPRIRVNALIVGLVHNDAGIEHYGGDEGFRRVADMLPLKRMASPEDVANAVLMMCSDRAAYISGANLEVDGGGEVPVFLHLANASSTAK